MSRYKNRPQNRAQNQSQNQIEKEKQRALEILECESSTTPDELLDLIHDINPTARGLPREEEALRYEIKGRLQSYLLRHFPHEIQVQTAQKRDRKVISLEHRHTWRNACHTVLDCLDEDARAWVQAQLAGLAEPDEEALLLSASAAPSPSSSLGLGDDERDRDPGQGRPRPRPRAQLAAEGPLLQGLVAQASYDYEAARAHFQDALAGSGGGAQEAVALLRLLIDHLAADADALALIPALSEAARARGEVRLLLAIAAAREEEEALALEMVTGISGSRRPREAVVHLLLCRTALRRRDLALAEEHLAHARERDPAHPEIQEVRDEISRARADERLPLEQHLGRLCAAGDYDAAEGEARALLLRWPESEPARRALRAIGEHRRTAEAQRLRAQADEAAARGQRGAAMSLLQKALATGLHGDLQHAIKDELSRLEQEEQAQRQANRVSECAALLARGDLLAGLLAFGALPAALREEVEARVPSAPFALWREVGQARCAASPRDIAEATCALLQAQQLAEPDPGAALALLGQHARPLEHVPLRKTVERTAQEQILRHFHACVGEQIDAAYAALGEGDLARAQALIAELDLRMLPQDDLADAEALKAAIDLLTERRQLTGRFVSLLLAGNLFAARGVVDQIQLRHPDFGAAFWRKKRALVVDLINRAFSVWVHHGPGLKNELCDHENSVHIHRDPMTWIWTAGNALVLAECEDEQVFIRLVCLDTGLVRTRAWLRVPEALSLSSVHVDEESVWLLGKQGQVLQLSLPDCEVLRWYGAGEILDLGGTGQELAMFVMAPGSRFLWMLLGQDETHRTVVADVGHLHLSRDIGERRYAVTTPGAGEFEVCCGKKDDVMSLHTGRGTVVHQISLPLMRIEPALAAHPTGPGLLLCCRPAPQDGFIDGVAPEMAPLHFFGVAPDGTVSDLGTQLASVGVERYRLATSRASRASYLRVEVNDGGYGICCLRARDQQIKIEYAVRVPTETLLVRDSAGQHVYGLTMNAESISATRLGEQATVLPGEKDHTGYGVVALSSTLRCGKLQLVNNDARKTIARTLAKLRDRDSWLALYLDRHKEDPEQLRSLICAIDHAYEPGLCLRIVRRVHELYPNMAEAAIVLANSMSLGRESDAILKVLRRVELRDLPARLQRHVYHMRALAHLWKRRYGKARTALRRAQRCVIYKGQTSCNLSHLRAVLDPLPEHVTLSDIHPSLGSVRQLALTLRLVDEQLHPSRQDGDLLEAWHALERRLVWRENEVQALARLVQLYLRVRTGRPELDFRKARILSRFLMLMEMGAFYDRFSLRLPRHTWPKRRMMDLVAQAREWLDRMRLARLLDCAPDEVPDSEAEGAVAEEADPAQGDVDQQQQDA